MTLIRKAAFATIVHTRKCLGNWFRLLRMIMKMRVMLMMAFKAMVAMVVMMAMITIMTNYIDDGDEKTMKCRRQDESLPRLMCAYIEGL